VQIGAFSNASEARNLKTTFDKKGYTTYITVARDNKKRKVYKVKTGEFKERKDAAILALRLKKTEGLTTYVTAKSE
jgi:cell division septation protein DedD